MRSIPHLFLGIFILFGGAFSTLVCAQDRPLFENDQIKLLVIPRSPNQMAGFYEARGFPKQMINVLTEFCFMTVVIHNKTKDVFWLNLDEWKFISAAGELQRIHRSQWPSRWEGMNIPMAAQSTFRWTLLPESLEFFPDEHEGGNVVLVSSKDNFSLQARFPAGKNKSKGDIVVQINDLMCARDSQEIAGGVNKP